MAGELAVAGGARARGRQNERSRAGRHHTLIASGVQRFRRIACGRCSKVGLSDGRGPGCTAVVFRCVRGGRPGPGQGGWLARSVGGSHVGSAVLVGALLEGGLLDERRARAGTKGGGVNARARERRVGQHRERARWGRPLVPDALEQCLTALGARAGSGCARAGTLTRTRWAAAFRVASWERARWGGHLRRMRWSNASDRVGCTGWQRRATRPPRYRRQVADGGGGSAPVETVALGPAAGAARQSAALMRSR